MTTKPPDQQWHIQLCETRAHWAYLHHLGFGRPVYHTFLRFVGPHSNVVQEIQGGAALVNGPQAERISTKNFLHAARRSLLLNGSLPEFALLARVHDGYYRSVLHTHDIISGDEAPVTKMWVSTLDLTARFNANAPVYETRKLNCNSLTRTLSDALINPLPQRLTYALGFENPVTIDINDIQGRIKEIANCRHSLTTLKRQMQHLSQQINKPFEAKPISP